MVTTLGEGDLRLEPLTASRPEEKLGVVDLSRDGPILMGRARGCEVCLRDPTISRRHLSLVKRDGRWFVIDLGGRLGTSLNGVRLAPDEPAAAAPGDFLQVGPYAFRFESRHAPGSTVASTHEQVGPGTVVERVPERELGSVAQRRLELLTDGAATVCQAGDEEELARTVVELALSGTGYPRAAVLRAASTAEHVEVLAFRDETDEIGAFSFSQSLIREAASGHLARLTRQTSHDLGQSIERLGITAALCAPIRLDASVVGFIYLDARETERPGDAHAVGFCQALAQLSGLALANLKRGELQARQRRLEEELRAAREAQAILCPPTQGQVDPLRYALRMEPGRVVAGDLFDIFALDETHVGICFGDVSGQGIRAAIHMSAVIAHMRGALRDGDPARAVGDLNRYIAERSPDDVFVSLWVGVFDGHDRALRYVDAGHGHWIIRRRDGAPGAAPRPQGLLVGIDPGFVYESNTLQLEEGDRVIFLSDGVTERTSPDGEMFGAARAAEVLASSGSAAEDVSALFEAVAAFARRVGVADDTTVASIELVAP